MNMLICGIHILYDQLLEHTAHLEDQRIYTICLSLVVSYQKVKLYLPKYYDLLGIL